MNQLCDSASCAPGLLPAALPPGSLPFCLPTAIKEFVELRDEIWRRVKDQLRENGRPAARDLALLKAANDGARHMVTLTPGPNTPVLHPLRAKVELLLCDVCHLVLKRIDYEVPAARRALHIVPDWDNYGG